MTEEQRNEIKEDIMPLHMSRLEKDAYQFAYDRSEDWRWETAGWNDVQDAFIAGFMNCLSEDNLGWIIKKHEEWSSMFNPDHISFREWLIDEFKKKCCYERNWE